MYPTIVGNIMLPGVHHATRLPHTTQRPLSALRLTYASVRNVNSKVQSSFARNGPHPCILSVFLLCTESKGTVVWGPQMHTIICVDVQL